jgi:hypothetical protein
MCTVKFTLSNKCLTNINLRDIVVISRDKKYSRHKLVLVIKCKLSLLFK